MEFKRSHRVGESIHKEISSLLIKGLKDPRVGFVTITAVEVTSDLRYARVYFSVMGDESALKKTLEGLKSSIPFLRRHLGRQLRMRYVPELQFRYDESLEYGNRIESLIKEIKQNDDADDSIDTEQDS